MHTVARLAEETFITFPRRPLIGWELPRCFALLVQSFHEDIFSGYFFSLGTFLGLLSTVLQCNVNARVKCATVASTTSPSIWILTLANALTLLNHYICLFITFILLGSSSPHVHVSLGKILKPKLLLMAEPSVCV